MGTITILNKTDFPLHVRISIGGDTGNDNPFRIDPEGSDTWSRNHPQTCVVVSKTYDAGPKIFPVTPGETYVVIQ
jgi:hypothetical protein